MDKPTFEQIKRAYGIRVEIRQQEYDKLMVKVGDYTRRANSAHKALAHAQFEYDTLKPPAVGES